jgi:GWxTD domain-containing protein
MIAWLLSEQDRQGVWLPGVARLGMKLAADTSFKLALSLDRTNPRYMLTMGQYRLGRGFLSLQRFQAYRLFEHALDAARKGDDRSLHAEAALELGRVYWRRYDTFVNRRLETVPYMQLRSMTAARQRSESAIRLSPAAVRRIIEDNTQPLPDDVTGESEYAQAEQLFREAYGAAPDDPRTYRQLAVLLATEDRWSELVALSRERVTSRPADPWGWMTLGLGLRRQGTLVPAESAFVAGMARLSAADRGRLDRLERVMSPIDTVRLAAMTAEERARAENTFWFFADPLWSRDGNDARTEFLARVTFAELRWTVEELGVRGIDSDRGRIHVRFGPPQTQIQLSPFGNAPMISDPLEGAEFDPSKLPFAPQPFREMALTDADRDLSVGGVTTIWVYENGWVFFFRGAPAYATSYIPDSDIPEVLDLIDENPARWANVAGVSVEPMPTVVARFRHGTDSASVVVAVDAPVSRIRRETSANTRVRGDFWFLGRDVPNAYRDSAWLSRDAHAWAVTVPAGTYAYRVEATSDAATVAGMTGDWVAAAPADATGFALRGFGMSDILLGTGGEPVGNPGRWFDVKLAAIGGTIPVYGDVELLWENYEFGASDGSARYDVTITVQREYALLVNRIRARIVGGAATLLGIDRVEGRVVIRFEREVAHAPALVDHLVLSMDGVPAGDYQLTIGVRDRTTGRTATRRTRIFVRE